MPEAQSGEVTCPKSHSQVRREFAEYLVPAPLGDTAEISDTVRATNERIREMRLTSKAIL